MGIAEQIGFFAGPCYWSLHGSITPEGDFVVSSLRFLCAPALFESARSLGVLLAFASLGIALTLSPAHAADDIAQEFLDELRQRGWHEVALEYLETADEDPIASAAFLDRLDYEKALTLAAMAQESMRDSERTRLYDRSIKLLEEYASAHRETKYYYEASSRAAKMLAEQAHGKLNAAKLLPESAQRRDLLTEARARLQKSSDILSELLAATSRKLDSLPKGALSHKDPEINKTRQRLATTQAEARFLAANLIFETAETYPEGSAEYRDSLESAAESFAQLHKDYEEKLVGFFGRLFEGRSRQSLAQWKEALKCYDDLVRQPISNPEFRKLVARAYRRRAECLVATGKLEEAIEECDDWLQQSRASERKEPEWLAVSYRLGEALQQQSLQVTGSESTRLESESRQLMREVARHPGEFQAVAKASLASSGRSEDIDPIDAEDFDQAFQAGKDALDRMKSSQMAAKLAANNNPEAQPVLARQAEENKAAAKQFFEMAIRLADEDSPPEDLLSAQFYLCLFYWEEGQIYEAAILGSYLARQYPESNYAASAAKVALVAKEKLYREASKRGEDTEYEGTQLSEFAQYVARRWPSSAEAGAAASLLIQIALEQDRLGDAEQMLEQLPKSSRASAELSLGSTLWTQYLKAIQANGGKANAESKQTLQRAAELLASGYQGLDPSSTPTSREFNGTLYYLQLLLNQDNAKRAKEVLENPNYGPLAALNQKSVDILPIFRLEAYKAALRTYASLVPPQHDKIRQTMDSLEQSIGDGPKASQQLTHIYLNLGGQLQRQIAELKAQGKADQSEKLATVFEALLERITSRGDAKAWSIRAWIAQTNLQLGEGLSDEAAAPYLKQAQEMYQAMLDDARKDPKYAPRPDDILALRKQLGDCLRAQRKFDDALKQYEGILKQKPNKPDLQRSVALMLQEWGKHERSLDKLNDAVRGAMPQTNNKNLVWGWLRLASTINRAKQRVADNPRLAARYNDLFFEARLNVAKTRLYAAQISSGEDKQKFLQSASDNIKSMERLYPDLGGAQWKRAFTQLKKEIEAEG